MPSAPQPALEFTPEQLLPAQDVRVAFFDVDGVLTDGGLYFSEHEKRSSSTGQFYVASETIKRFNTLDGHGLKLLQYAGITPVVITGRDSLVLRARLDALGITNAYFGTEDKLPCAEEALKKMGLSWTQAAAMGDDWPDLPVMRRAAASCAPAGAHAELRAMAHHVTHAVAGHGAVREWCDLLLTATGHYARLLQAYLR